MITKNENGSFTISSDMILETTIGKREGGKTLQALSGDFGTGAMEKFLRYGFQRVFNDKIGGTDTKVEEKVISAEQMIERFKRGEIGRVSIGSVDPLVSEIRAIVRKNLRSKNPGVWKIIRQFDAAKLNEKLDAIFANQSEEKREELTALAKKEIARKIADGKKQAAIDLGNIDLGGN